MPLRTFAAKSLSDGIITGRVCLPKIGRRHFGIGRSSLKCVSHSLIENAPEPRMIDRREGFRSIIRADKSR